MPELVRLYIRQVLVGFLLSAVLVAAYLWLNIANLWHLVTHSDAGLLAVFLLWLFHGIVLAGVQFGIAIMNMADNADPGDSGKGARLAVDMLPVAIPVRDNRPIPNR